MLLVPVELVAPLVDDVEAAELLLLQTAPNTLLPDETVEPLDAYEIFAPPVTAIKSSSLISLTPKVLW
jgi:hypothetical protein